MKKTAVVLLFILMGLCCISAENLSITSSRDFQFYTNRRPVIIIFSLGCDIGGFVSDAFFSGFRDLSGVDLGVIDINQSDEVIGYNSYNNLDFELGTLAIAYKGKLVRTETSDKVDLYGLNQQRRWVYASLTDLAYNFTLKMHNDRRIKPDVSNRTVELSKNRIAFYDFEKDASDTIGNYPKIPIRGANTVRSGVLQMFGEGGTEVYNDAYKLKDSFSFALSFFMNSEPEFLNGGVIIDFGNRYLNLSYYKNSIYLIVDATYQTSRKDAEGNPVWDYSPKECYILNEVNLKAQTWNHIVLSFDGGSTRMQVMLNGNRLDDIQPSDYFVQAYKQSSYKDSLNFEFHRGGAPYSFNGKADNLLIFNKVLNNSEMLSVYDQYAYEKAMPNVPDPSSFWTGSWNMYWGSNEKIKLSMQESGSTVTGTYEWRDGRLTGTLQGKTLRGNWTQSNNSGWFIFVLNDDSNSFSGEWGYQKGVNQGIWNGFRN
jgi:hypothetical protein